MTLNFMHQSISFYFICKCIHERNITVNVIDITTFFERNALGVNERDASSDQTSRYACPIVLEGVDADAVRRLHPSK